MKTTPVTYQRLGLGDTDNSQIQPESCRCAAIDGYQMAGISGGSTIGACENLNPWKVPAGTTSLTNNQPTSCCGNQNTEYFRYRECKGYACPSDVNDRGCCRRVEACGSAGGGCYAPIDNNPGDLYCKNGLSGDTGEYSVCSTQSDSHYVWDDQDTNQEWCDDITTPGLSSTFCITGNPKTGYTGRSCWMGPGEQSGSGGTRDGTASQNFCCGDEPYKEAFRIVECGGGNYFCPDSAAVECCSWDGSNLPALTPQDQCVGSGLVRDLDNSGGVSISMAGKWWDPDDACASNRDGCTAVNCAGYCPGY